MSKSVGIREAKARFSHYVELARSGNEIVITDRGRPMVRLVAVVPGKRGTAEGVFRELEEAGLVEPGSGKKLSPPKPPIKPRGRASISAVVREMRR
jgi:prevent-host-death family protein